MVPNKSKQVKVKVIQFKFKIKTCSQTSEVTSQKPDLTVNLELRKTQQNNKGQKRDSNAMNLPKAAQTIGFEESR